MSATLTRGDQVRWRDTGEIARVEGFVRVEEKVGFRPPRRMVYVQLEYADGRKRLARGDQIEKVLA